MINHTALNLAIGNINCKIRVIYPILFTSILYLFLSEFLIHSPFRVLSCVVDVNYLVFQEVYSFIVYIVFYNCELFVLLTV